MSHLPRGPIGFRLANELEGLLRGIAADGVITPAETTRVRAWLDANRHFRDIRPFSELAGRLEAALADGQLTTDEVDDLLFVVCKLTTVNPHFDQIRGGVQQLIGLLTGYAADAALSENELGHLSIWINDWAHLRGSWPFDECEALVTQILVHGRHSNETAWLLDLARQFPVAGATAADAPPLLIGGICAVDPVIAFPERRFVFTGTSPRAPRLSLEAHITERGGTAERNVTKTTDYLIVCDEANPLWAFACYGRKVEKAYNLRRQGQPITIAHEVDFWDALAGQR